MSIERSESADGGESSPDALADELASSGSAVELEEKRDIRRAVTLGLYIWPAFFALDVYMAAVVVPEAPLGLFLGYRLLFELLLLAVWRGMLRPEASVRSLRLGNRVMACGAALFIALMALRLGGLSSPYVHGLSIVMLVLSVTIPTPWRLSLTWLVPTALVFPLVMALASLWDPAVRAEWRDAHQVALFGAHYFFVLAAAAIGSLSGNLVWLARRQVYEARRIGRYRLKAPIGRGGMNEVWMAWDGTLHRDVALKILRASDVEQRRALERFLREARALGRLESPHTVRVYDFGGSDDGLFFIAMERLVGEDLQRLVERSGPLGVARTVHVARQVCRSLAEAHRLGIVHRDIKPANILLTRAGHQHDVVKVVDFGLAKVLERGLAVTQTMMIAGTPHYMAPELWRGGVAHPGSDLYALGATMYFLLSGAEPFPECGSLQEMARAHLEIPPTPLSAARGGEVSASLDAVVLKCMAKSPEERYATAEELLAALESCPDVGNWTEEDALREWSERSEAGVLWSGEEALGVTRAPTVAIDEVWRDGR